MSGAEFFEQPWGSGSVGRYVGMLVAGGDESAAVAQDEMPQKRRRRRTRWFWLGCGIGAAVLLLGAAAAVVPCRGSAKPIAARRACINNLLMIESAKEQWALDNQNASGDHPSEAEIYGTKGSRGYMKYPPSCPNGGEYVIGAIGKEPTCSMAERGHRIR